MDSNSRFVSLPLAISLAVAWTATMHLPPEARAAQQDRVLDSGVLRFFQGTPPSEVARESFVITARRFESETTVPILDLRIAYVTEYGPDGDLRRFEGRATRLSDDSVVTLYTAEPVGDILEMRQVRGGQDTSWTATASPDAVLSSQTLAAFVELIRRAGRRDTVFRVWSPELNELVDVSLAFEADTVRMQSLNLPLIARLDPSGRVANIAVPTQGLRAEPAQIETLPPLSGVPECEAPDYSAPEGAPYTADDVRIPVQPAEGEAFELAGTLTVPTSGLPPYPAVITISGSGLQNRDEEICPLVVGYRPFRQIAERLAEEGIAVLRVDERMVGESGGDATGATTVDFANDIRAEVAWLRERPEIDPDRIALVGHSEGGVIAPMIAVSDPRIAAIVLMAGTAKTGLEVLRYQVTYPIRTAEGLSEEQRSELAGQAIAQLESTPGQNAWLRYFRTYDPVPTARQVSQPVLILQGELDRQVTADQATMLETAIREGGNEDVEIEVYDGLNHLFLISQMDGSPAEYMTLDDVEIPAYVLDGMAAWLAARIGPGR